MRTQHRNITSTTTSRTMTSRNNSRRKYRPTTETILKPQNQGRSTLSGIPTITQSYDGTTIMAAKELQSSNKGTYSLLNVTTTKLNLFTSTESIRKQYFRTRSPTKVPKVHVTTSNVNRFLSGLSLDQTSDSSNQQPDNKDMLAEKPLTLKEVTEAVTRNRNSGRLKLASPEATAAPKTTIVVTTPKIIGPHGLKSKKRTQNVTSQLANTVKPLKYDYYENFSGILKSIPEQSKVLIDDNGVIHCLDQGNFPHPVSCKKFISCARMEGKVLGWEYTCPKRLSFDPIGGMCNWSADLGCDE